MCTPTITDTYPTQRSVLIVLAAAGLTALLTLLTYRGQRVIGFDSHYYLEYAKSFRTVLPEQFGTHWPFGYPLLGAALARVTGSAFFGLLGVSWLAWFATCALIWPPLLTALGPAPARAALLCFAAAAIALIELGTLRSELAFTALSTGAVTVLARDTTPRSAWIAAVAIVLAFTIRYAGILGLPMLGCWQLATSRGGRISARARQLLPLVCAAALCFALMLWNLEATGFASGASRSPGSGLGGLPVTVADFGWSAIVALTTIGVRQAVLSHPFMVLVVGWTVSAGILALGARAWFRPVSDYSRPFAIGLTAYTVGMVLLAARSEFDSLYNGRTFLPALPLAVVLVLERFRLHPWRAVVVAGVFIALPGAAIALRGISPALVPDFSSILPRLHAGLEPTDTVGVNLHAIGLSAALRQRVVRVDDGESVTAQHRFLVFLCGPDDPPGTTWFSATLPADFQLEVAGPRASLWRQRPPPSPVR